MAKTTTIELPEHQLGFLQTQVEEGLYGSTSEAVQAAVRLLEEQEAKLSSLRAALEAGEESGPGRPLDQTAFLARMRAASGR